MSDQCKRAKDGVELPGNTQEKPSKSATDPNTQLLEGSHNTDIETPVVVRNTEDRMDINPKERVTETIVDEMQLSMTHNLKKKIPMETSNPKTDPLDIEAQVAVLEKRRRKVHLQLKLKKLQEEEVLGFLTSTDASLKEIAGLSKNEQLALECAKHIRMPDVYKSES